MRSAAFSLFVAGAAAQITLPPIVNFAAQDDLDACNSVIPVISSCYSSFGGSSGVLTANPLSVMGCACCSGSNGLAPAYSACSSELRPLSSSAAAVYGSLYSVCNLGATCGVASATRASASASGSRTITAAPSSRSSASVSGGNSQACYDMLNMYSQCLSQTKDFSDLPFQSQAPCYCCATARGTTTWTDELDNYAATCANWASGSETSIYSVASRFTGFCSQFSNACEAVATTSSSSSGRSSAATTTSESSSSQTAAATTSADAGGDAPQTRVGAYAGLAVLSALFLAL